MRQAPRKVVVDRPVVVLAANKEPVMLLRPGATKGCVVVEFEGAGTVILQEPLGCEEELLDAVLVVYSDEPDGEE